VSRKAAHAASFERRMRPQISDPDDDKERAVGSKLGEFGRRSAGGSRDAGVRFVGTSTRKEV